MKIEKEKKRLLQLIKKKALKLGSITLSSGKKSNWYVDLRLITLDAEGAYLIGKILFELLKGEDIDALGGPTIGADPICGSFATISHLNNTSISTFIIRKNPKKHGRMRQVEGPLKEGNKVVIIDDVSTSGGSLIKAIQVVEGENCKVLKIITIVDREEGAKEKLSQEGYNLTSIFSKKDLLE